jgi:membrane protease YdiL (CAAX protease family)
MDRCARSVCKGERTERPGYAAVKYSEVFEMILAVGIAYLIGSIIIALLPRNNILQGYASTGAIWVVAWGLKRRYSFRLFFLGDARKTWACGIASGVTLLGLHLLVRVSFPSYPPADYVLFLHYGYAEKCLFALDMVVLRPIVEEILFRGFIYRVIKERHGPLLGAAVSIGLFAAVHGFALHSFLLGAVFTFVYRKSGNVWAAVMAHVTQNLASLLFQYLF